MFSVAKLCMIHLGNKFSYFPPIRKWTNSYRLDVMASQFILADIICRTNFITVRNENFIYCFRCAIFWCNSIFFGSFAGYLFFNEKKKQQKVFFSESFDVLGLRTVKRKEFSRKSLPISPVNSIVFFCSSYDNRRYEKNTSENLSLTDSHLVHLVC